MALHGPKCKICKGKKMRYKILLISADAYLRDYVNQAFDEQYFSVLISSTGKGVQETIRQLKPDLLLINWLLPDLNGMAILRAVLETDLADRTPIIMIGAETSQEQRILALELGADLCLTTPIQSKVFLAHVRSLLRRNHVLNNSMG